MMQLFWPTQWPHGITAATRNSFDKLSRGWKYVTLQRSPTSFIRIREVGYPEREQWLMLGRPMRLNPKSQYEVRACGFDTDVPGIGGGAIVIGKDTTPYASAQDPNVQPQRLISGETVLVCSDVPVPGGYLRLRTRAVFGASGSVIVLFRTSAVGLAYASMSIVNGGADTATVYAATCQADSSAAYAVGTGWFVTAPLTAATNAQARFVFMRGYFPNVASVISTSGLPLDEQIAGLATVTFSGGATLVTEVVGHPIIGSPMEFGDL